MKLDQRTATIIMQEVWDKALDFQKEDKHAYYFESDEQEMKLWKDYGDSGFFFVESRDLGQEDWLGWSTITYDEIEEVLRKVQLSERNRHKQQELTM